MGKSNSFLHVDGLDYLFEVIAITLVMNIGDLNEAMPWLLAETNAFDTEPGGLEPHGVRARHNRRSDHTC